LRPGLLESGAAQDGSSNGGLNEFTTVGHACLLIEWLKNRWMKG
jgi:hypothetical protein